MKNNTQFQDEYIKPKELIHPLFKRTERFGINNLESKKWRLINESPGYYLENYFEVIAEEPDTMKMNFYGADIAVVTLARKNSEPQNGICKIKVDDGNWIETNNYWQEPWTKIKTTKIAQDLDEQLHELTLITVPQIIGDQRVNKQEIVNFLISSDSDVVFLKD